MFSWYKYLIVSLVFSHLGFRSGNLFLIALFPDLCLLVPFDVPGDVMWWAMRKLGMDEWLVHLVQSMYKDVRSRVKVCSGYSEEFGVKVGVHQGSVLSPLLFITMLEALSREFRTGCPWELLYTDDLMIRAESMEELLVKLKTWKAERKLRPLGEHGNDKDHGLWPQSGPSEKIWKGSLWHLSRQV